MSSENTGPATPRQPPAGGLEPLLSIQDLSDYLGVPVATIYDWWVAGKGPRAVRVGRHVKFAAGDVRDWVSQQREPAPGRRGSGG